MGTFLALSSIIGQSKDEVAKSLEKYAVSVNGGLQQAELSANSANCCALEERQGNTTILYPNGYLEWDNSAAFISKDLNATVFSFHIHDGDLWMYLLYNKGELADQFNPLPDYWDENISADEANSWQGNVSTIVSLLPNLQPADIERYLVRWNLDAEEPAKAYPSDDFSTEDWQLLDFMNKLRLPYPVDDNGKLTGETFRLWTNQLQLSKQPSKQTPTASAPKASVPEKPWWKFW